RLYTFEENKRLQAWGDWLKRYPWIWYCHLTFKDEEFNGKKVALHPKRAITLFNRFRQYVGLNTLYFWAMEHKGFTDSPHLHCLLGSCSIAGKPIWGYGRYQIEPYCSNGGGRFYVAKEIVRGG